MRQEMRKKYKEKIATIKRRHMVDEEEKISRVPPELKDYERASVFSKLSFDSMEETALSVSVIGDIDLTEEEKLVLKKHPKFALLENIKIEDLELEFELSFGKYRYQRSREIRENKELKKEREKTGVGGTVEDRKSVV